MKISEQYLIDHGVKPTAVRILVWEEIERTSNLFSLGDLEEAMPFMDRSSIFRALKLFVDNNLLHEIDDGSGRDKYCVCHCHSEEHRGHVHFQCTKCGTTYCLENLNIPNVNLPQGYVANEYEYIIKGKCPSCK